MAASGGHRGTFLVASVGERCASMYRRLRVINHWLEWLGLTRAQMSFNAATSGRGMPVQPLDTFASVLEPVKNYARQKYYKSFTPLNRLPDSIPPESDVAREFPGCR